MVKVRFSASGFGSTTYEHADEESAWAAMRADAREVADEHGGEVNEAGDEIVVARPGGDENRKMGAAEIAENTPLLFHGNYGIMCSEKRRTGLRGKDKANEDENEE